MWGMSNQRSKYSTTNGCVKSSSRPGAFSFYPVMRLLSLSSFVEYFSMKLSKEWNIYALLANLVESMLKSLENNMCLQLKNRYLIFVRSNRGLFILRTISFHGLLREIGSEPASSVSGSRNPPFSLYTKQFFKASRSPPVDCELLSEQRPCWLILCVYLHKPSVVSDTE